MGWSIGFDGNWKRDIGYAVPAICDHPGCENEIDRGISHVCGGAAYGGDDGCGLYFCSDHLYPIKCEQCIDDKEPFDSKPDIKVWIEHKLTHDSWKEWRDENPDEVKKMKLIYLRQNFNGK